MKLFGSGGKHKSNRSSEKGEFADEQYYEPEYSQEEEYDGYSGEYDEDVYNDYGETEEEVDEAIDAYKRKAPQGRSCFCDNRTYLYCRSGCLFRVCPPAGARPDGRKHPQRDGDSRGFRNGRAGRGGDGRAGG
jgi:hypothetical protein